MKPPLLQSLKLKQIEIADLQARAATDDKTITEYAEAYQNGEKFPPAVVFHDGKTYFLADGFHRYFGAQKAGLNDLLCDVRNGTRKDALWFAVGANRTHGLKRSNADKRNAAEMALRERPDMSDRALAEHVGVGPNLVTEIRQLLVRAVEIPNPTTRTGLDGRERKAPPIVPKAPLSPPPIVPKTQPAPVVQVPVPEPEKPKSSPPVVKPTVTIDAPRVVDKSDHPIPKALLPIWERAHEAQSLLTSVSKVRCALKEAQDTKDKLFLEVNFSMALAQLDQAYANIKTALPYAVCTVCQGTNPDCGLCVGRGFVSEHRWNTVVTKEAKEIRAKARK
jgi:hypothetical protein